MWFNIFTGYSGNTLFNTMCLLGFNMVFTNIIPFYIFDRDAPKAVMLAHPELYWSGQFNKKINYSTLAGWFAFAVPQSALTVFLVRPAHPPAARAAQRPAHPQGTGILQLTRRAADLSPGRGYSCRRFGCWRPRRTPRGTL